MSKADTIRNEVSKAYARAVAAPPKSGCCGDTVAKGVASQLAGYSEGDLSQVPHDAATNSFGCGNPVAFSEVREGEVVLDLGSGAGIDLILAARKVGPSGRVIGVDMTDEMIDRARANIADSGFANIEVRKGFIESLPVKDGSVDWVISNCVINLSPEKERVFAEIARVLKPGGRMLVSDIVVESLPEELRRSQALYSSCIAGAIPESEYLAGLNSAGLADVEVRSRLTYDSDQICGLVESEADGGGCCGTAVTGEIAKEASKSLAGKIWSANISARKP
jgi:SAM-dependent methyltransferase